ncbi:MAG: DNA-methyltransferase [Brevibacterium aurantiacum]|uniref:DNA-methyltransferase n=1 Tax=Brevibacterium aurantiacum TaxID=273384 RepID=UPI003F8EB161
MNRPSMRRSAGADPIPLKHPKFVVREHHLGTKYSDLAEPDGPSGLVLGDSLAVLSNMPEKSVQTVVTSPPYWSLRDYGIDGQVGLNETVYAYIDSLADLFDQVLRVLRDDGTLWLNIGDSYTSGNRGWRAPDKKNRARAMSLRPPTPEGLKEKDLIGVPWRIAFALQERGWYLRSEVIWQKPNAQPESVRDRPTRAHEQVFLFSKSERYFYDVDAVKGPNDRRLRSVWDIKTRANRAAAGHFATFPTELVDRCIKITSTPGDLVLDPFLGSGTTALSAGALNRRFCGVELNPDYLAMSRSRLMDVGFEELVSGEDQDKKGGRASGAL